MRKVKYVFNDRTLQYEKHKLSYKQIAFKLITQTSAIVFTGLVFHFAFTSMFPSQNEKALTQELKNAEYQLKQFSFKVESLNKKMDELHQKDNQVNRMILGVSEIDEGIWEGGIGGHDKFKHHLAFESTGEIIKTTLEKIDKIERKVELQKESLDEIYSLAMKREKKMASIPSIKPVRGDKLKKDIELLSGFGWRIHPVYKVKKFHYGMDFTSPQGTVIVSTGDGKVTKIERVRSGYGNYIEIDHGYGYKTLYAHMDKIDVKVGQKVTKGQKVGTVGNTGTSTAPHLHYEVRINGEAVDPVDYVMDGLTTAEYLEVVKKAAVANQSYD
jgi:murein DD-endopeptidase MepM/ murein hydrolase activator NlpD